ILAAVGHERADLDERAGVEQQVEALARGEASLLVLLGDARLTTAGHGLLAATAQLGRSLLSIQRVLHGARARAGARVGSPFRPVKDEPLVVLRPPAGEGGP